MLGSINNISIYLFGMNLIFGVSPRGGILFF